MFKVKLKDVTKLGCNQSTLIHDPARWRAKTSWLLSFYSAQIISSYYRASKPIFSDFIPDSLTDATQCQCFISEHVHCSNQRFISKWGNPIIPVIWNVIKMTAKWFQVIFLLLISMYVDTDFLYIMQMPLKLMTIYQLRTHKKLNIPSLQITVVINFSEIACSAWNLIIKSHYSVRKSFDSIWAYSIDTWGNCMIKRGKLIKSLNTDNNIVVKMMTLTKKKNEFHLTELQPKLRGI